jgi:hypothetical protein
MMFELKQEQGKDNFLKHPCGHISIVASTNRKFERGQQENILPRPLINPVYKVAVERHSQMYSFFIRTQQVKKLQSLQGRVDKA